MNLPSHHYAAINTRPDEQDTRAIARWMYQQAIRYDFAVPGAALLALAPGTTSQELRRLMVAVKEYLAFYHYISTNQYLAYFSLGRINQPATSSFHLDAAPDEAFLMLGYEASSVVSKLAIADYSRAAHDLGVTPREFLQRFNLMDAGQEQRLQPYVLRWDQFDASRPHLALFNNSTLPYTPTGDNTLGVMCVATIVSPQPNVARVVNSMTLSVVNEPSQEPVTPEVQQWFLETEEIANESTG